MKKHKNPLIISMNETSIPMLFLYYCLTAVLTSSVRALHTTIDSAFISNIVGTQGLSAITLTMPFVTFISATSIGISTGFSILIAQRKGAGNYKGANITFTYYLLTAIVSSLCIMVGFLCIGRQFFQWMGAESTVLEYAWQYGKVYSCFTLFTVLATGLSIVVRNDEEPMLSTTSLFMGLVSNLVLNYLFLVVFQWNMIGAALATGLAQIVSFCCLLSHFIRKKGTLRIQFGHIKRARVPFALKMGVGSFIVVF